MSGRQRVLLMKGGRHGAAGIAPSVPQNLPSTLLTCLLVVTLLTGCASLGIRPNPTDYQNTKAKAACQSRHGTPAAPPSEDYSACVEYEMVRRYAEDLKEAYEARAAINRWAIWWGGILGLGSLGALAGLMAFGSAGSAAAKIIPLAGSFVGGSIAFSQNDEKATVYDEAAVRIEDALDPPPPPNAKASGYLQAKDKLTTALKDVHKYVIQKRAEITSKEAKQISDLQKQNDQLRISPRYTVVDITLQQPTNTQATITVSDTIDLALVPLSEIKVKFGTEDVTVVGVDNKTLTVDFPDTLLNGGSFPVQVFFKKVPLAPVRQAIIPKLLKLEPNKTSVGPNQQVQFTVKGGVGPYTYSVSNSQSGAPAIGVNTGLYTAGSSGGGKIDTIHVEDGSAPHLKADAHVTVQ